MALEIERKFLLKKLPSLEWDMIYKITQIYCDNEGLKYRIRERKTLIGEGKTEYFKTIKKEIEPGVNEEDENIVEMQDFLEGLSYETRRITKTRYLKKFTEDLKLEIDDFGKLVIAEIELLEIGQKFDLPDYIKDILIIEVTKIKEFSNYNLAS